MIGRLKKDFHTNRLATENSFTKGKFYGWLYSEVNYMQAICASFFKACHYGIHLFIDCSFTINVSKTKQTKKQYSQNKLTNKKTTNIYKELLLLFDTIHGQFKLHQIPNKVDNEHYMKRQTL